MQRFPILLIFVLLVACDFTVPGPSEPDLLIASKQSRWQAKQISSYRISVLKVQAVFHAQTNTITVTDGKVTNQSAICTPAPMEGKTCEVQAFDPNEFTVPALFETALRYAPESEKYQLRVTFDDTYNYPTTLSFDQKEVIDDEQFYRVISFQPLP
jgi:hypothetical protein